MSKSLTIDELVRELGRLRSVAPLGGETPVVGRSGMGELEVAGAKITWPQASGTRLESMRVELTLAHVPGQIRREGGEAEAISG